ncbi:NAD(P)-binding protein [Sphingomicrobium nitratireducens]|uniref:NAD(P)-binding protein n=1 Tax=Sphingomicrobium nitratireducens TaxID=2964666 RepID=UPI00223ED03D|nr:NAD(P)-binding protein [Sphingomicrobium nitratireducens]
MAGLQTDYCIIGAGASGLAFADTLLAQDPAADIVIIDNHARPGGHWNDAYSFVTLHQPSAFYGVNSLELCDGEVDRDGLNKGLLGLASGSEVSVYFEKVMTRRLLPSGRVRYFPSHEWLGEGRFRSILTGEEKDIAVRRALVDSTYYGTTVPSTHTPRFDVEEGARMVPPNALPHLWKEGENAPRAFVVLGGGKTAIDTVLWLLQSGVEAPAITWVRPRDSWLFNRSRMQPGMDFFEQVFEGQADWLEAIAAASDPDDLFERLEAVDYMLRIDPDHRPSMFHYATSSPAEVALARTVENVVRRGHVRSIGKGRMTFDDGDSAVPDGALFIDCTATAVTRRPPVPLWADGRITLQMIRIPQPAFSAALTAFIEANYTEDEKKNALARPIPLPDGLDQYALATMVNMLNQKAWNEEEKIGRFLVDSRLDGFAKTVAAVAPDDTARMAILKRMRAASKPAFANLMRLVQATT